VRVAAVLAALALLGGPGLAVQVTLEVRAGQGAALEARVDAVPLGPFTLGASLGWGPAGWVALRGGIDHSLGPAGLISSAVEGLVATDLSLWALARVRATLGPVDLSLRGHLATRPLAQITGPLAGRPAGTDPVAQATASLRLDGTWRLDRHLAVEAGVEGQERAGVSTLAIELGVSLPNLVERGVNLGFTAGAGGPGGSWHTLIRLTDRSGPAATQFAFGIGEQAPDQLAAVPHSPRIAPGFLVAHTVPLGSGPALPGAPGAVAEATVAWLPWAADRPLLARLEIRAAPGRGLLFRAGLETDAVSITGRVSGTMTF
jgi:hypothetical protein